MKERLRRLLFGSPEGMAGTVYGTIVVLATLTALVTTWRMKQGIERRAGAVAPSAA